MPINPSIILGIKPPEITHYARPDPAESIGQALRIKALMGQNQIQDTALADDAAVREAYQQGGGDVARVRQLLSEKGLYKQVQSMDAFDLDRRAKQSGIDKDESARKKTDYDLAQKKLGDIAGMVAAAKANPAAWGSIRRQAQMTFGPEATAEMPEQYDPNYIAAKEAQLYDHYKQLEANQKAGSAAETARHNKATEGLTARGQNMVDAREKEKNAGVLQSADYVGPSINNPGITKKDRSKLLVLQPKEKAAVDGIRTTMDSAISSIDKLVGHEGLSGITGTIYGRTPSVAPSSVNAQAVYDTLKSQLGVQTLNQMRASSPTGGAVGSVTEKEWPILQNQLGAIQQSQSKEQLESNLGEVRATIKRIRDSAGKAYAETYGGTIEESPTPPPSPTPRKPGGIDLKNLSDDELLRELQKSNG